MKIILVPLAATALLTSLSGCGNKSGDDVKQQAQNQLNAKGNAAIQSASYYSECSSSDVSIGDLKFPGKQTIFELSDLDFVKKEVYFSDDCKSPLLTVQQKGKIANVARSGAVVDALEEDINYEHTVVTVNSPVTSKAFNVAKICGIGDWAPNIDKEVNNQAGSGLCPGKPSPRTVRELVLVKDNALMLGGQAEEEKERPSTVDMNTPYKKQ